MKTLVIDGDKYIREHDLYEYMCTNKDWRLFGYSMSQIIDMIKFCDEQGRPKPL
jgi:hypothetical protein